MKLSAFESKEWSDFHLKYIYDMGKNGKQKVTKPDTEAVVIHKIAQNKKKSC
jgi:hypothetical protein